MMLKNLTLLIFLLSSGFATAQSQRYEARYDATDAGPILRHGDGPDNCDERGMREPSIVQENGKFYLFYDGCAAPGWLACLATSDDLKTWKKHGPQLSLGPAGSDDSATASSPWFIKEGDTWHMFYVAGPNASPAPDYVPMGPYLTMTATAKSLDGPWTQHRDIVPFRPKPGTWYELGAYPGHIIKHDGEYMMFFNGGHGIARTRDLMGPWKIDEEQSLHSPTENTSIYYEESNGTYWMFVNHIRMLPLPHTDATWVYWTKDPNKWSDRDRAVVLDGRNCSWSKTIIGMATVTKVGNRLAIFYDANHSNDHQHMGRDIGLAWLDLPLSPEKVKLLALPPNEDDDAGAALGEWIWHPTVGEEPSTLRFQGKFELPVGAKPDRARLSITADDGFTVWLNGERLGSGTNWQQLGVFDVTAQLRAGTNRLAIEVNNGGGPGGVIAGLTTWLADGRTIKFGTSGDWRCGQSGGEEWFAKDAPADWLPVKVLGNASVGPWNLSPPGADDLPSALAGSVPVPPAPRPNALLAGGFESAGPQWKLTGGNRIAYDWSRFPRDLWMGDYYLWLNGPDGKAEQTSSLVAESGKRYRLTAEVGYSLDIRDGNMPWPGGRLVLFTTGPDGEREETAIELPDFTSEEAGTFKHVSLEWLADDASKGRQIGVRLESKGPQIAWDNVRLEVGK